MVKFVGSKLAITAFGCCRKLSEINPVRRVVEIGANKIQASAQRFCSGDHLLKMPGPWNLAADIVVLIPDGQFFPSRSKEPPAVIAKAGRIDLNHFDCTVKNEKFVIVRSIASAVVDELFDNNAWFDVFINPFVGGFVIALTQPATTGFYESGPVECRFVGDDLNPTGTVRRLDDKPVRKLIERNGFGVDRDVIAFRQEKAAKSRFNIIADRCFICNLGQDRAAVETYPVPNFVINVWGRMRRAANQSIQRRRMTKTQSGRNLRAYFRIAKSSNISRN